MPTSFDKCLGEVRRVDEGSLGELPETTGWRRSVKPGESSGTYVYVYCILYNANRLSMSRFK